MNTLQQKIKRIPKKAWILAAAGLAVLVVCTVLTVVLVQQKRAAQAVNLFTESDTGGAVTESVTETLFAESTDEPSSETTTAAPKKPVGTTAPVAREEPALPPVRVQTNTHIPKKILDVPFIDQREKYPTGCESVAAVMAMQYYGIPITPETFIDRYLDKGVIPYRDEAGVLFGDDPRKVFLGNPYSEKGGWGCYAPVIVNAVKKCIDRERYTVRAVYGVSLDELCRTYIDQDVPVLVWATQNMAPSRTGKTWYITGTAETFTWISPMHCLLLVGYDDTGYYFNDSLQAKNYRYSKSAVNAAYDALGNQAVVILPKPPEPPTTEAPSETETTSKAETTGETESTGETEEQTDTPSKTTASTEKSPI